jgi:hypothetical protein
MVEVVALPAGGVVMAGSVDVADEPPRGAVVVGVGEVVVVVSGETQPDGGVAGPD